jgi:hypothetical protein
VIRFGPALVVIAIGATFAFAISPTAIPGINLTVAGIIVLLAGVVALVLSLRAGRPQYRTMSTWLRPTVYVKPQASQIKLDADAAKQPERASPPPR